MGRCWALIWRQITRCLHAARRARFVGLQCTAVRRTLAEICDACRGTQACASLWQARNNCWTLLSTKIGEVTLMRPIYDVSNIEHSCNSSASVSGPLENSAEIRDRTGDLQIFSLTLSQLSYRGLCKERPSQAFKASELSSRGLRVKQQRHARPSHCKQKWLDTAAAQSSERWLSEQARRGTGSHGMPRPGIEPGTFRSSV